jgi:hypothetical protein
MYTIINRARPETGNVVIDYVEEKVKRSNESGSACLLYVHGNYEENRNKEKSVICAPLKLSYNWPVYNSIHHDSWAVRNSMSEIDFGPVQLVRLERSPVFDGRRQHHVGNAWLTNNLATASPDSCATSSHNICMRS